MSPAKENVFDIRPLIARGQEPFSAIRVRVNALAPGQAVTIIAPFMPSPLIELLKSEGFSAALEHRADGAWAVNFRRE